MKLNDVLRLIAGIMVGISLLLQQFHDPLWIWFTVFIALNLGRIHLSGLGFVQSRSILIAARGLQHSSLCNFRATKSKMLLGGTRRAASVWHLFCVIAHSYDNTILHVLCLAKMPNKLLQIQPRKINAPFSRHLANGAQ